MVEKTGGTRGGAVNRSINRAIHRNNPATCARSGKALALGGDAGGAHGRCWAGIGGMADGR